MNSLEELLELTKFLEKESKDVNMNDISQVISFLKKYIDCQNKIINAFKENYDKKTIELSKYEQAIDIIKNKKVDMDMLIDSTSAEDYNVRIKYYNYINPEVRPLTQEEYELLKEVLGNES